MCEPRCCHNHSMMHDARQQMLCSRCCDVLCRSVLIGMVVLGACERAFAAPPTHVRCMPATSLVA